MTSTTTSKSFLIKDILSENCETTSSDDESNDNKDFLLTEPIDLRRFFKHPLCPIPLRPTSLTATLRNDVQNSPLDALFEMTKKTFDKTHKGKFIGYY